MLYITGLQALNLNCSLKTFGDWHQSSLSWKVLDFVESEDSFYGDYGLEVNCHIPCHEGSFLVANHLRAILDLLLRQEFSILQGMRYNFIGVDLYDEEFFNLVYCMHVLPYWSKIDEFMRNEYFMKWVRFMEVNNGGKLAV